MNEALNNLFTRHSVRSFSDRKIDRAVLEEIVKAGYHAPTAMNSQKRHFTVVQNKETIEKLAVELRRILNRDSGYNFYAPDTLILVSGPEDYRFTVQDCSCALENIFLAAHSFGVGSVWINQFCGNCDDPGLRALLNSLGTPSDHNVVGAAALGYPSGEVTGREKNPDVVSWAL